MLNPNKNSVKVSVSLFAALLTTYLTRPPNADAAAPPPKTKQQLDVAAKRAEAIAKMRAFAGSAKQEAVAKKHQDAAKALDKKMESQRLQRAHAKAVAKKMSAADEQKLMAKETPKYKQAVSKFAAHPLPKKVATKREPKKPVPAHVPVKVRAKPEFGALPQETLNFYASMAGEDVWVPHEDGSVSRPEEVLAGVDIPHARGQLAGVESDFGLALQLEGVLSPPVAADLAETSETRRTPTIVALAQQLNGDPLAIYNYVNTGVLPKLYYGSKLGADATLRTLQGNDFDTASLLIALLRASGISARYEYGPVQLSPAQVLALTGTSLPDVAVGLMNYVGIPANLGPDNTTVFMERTWVRAYVPYEDYKGTGPKTGRSQWVRLDAGLKQVTWPNAVNLKGKAFFDAMAYYTTVTPQTPLEVYEAQLLAQARALNLCNNLDAAKYTPKVTQAPLRLLPTESPALVKASLLVFAAPPSNLKWTVQMSLDGESQSFDFAELQYRKVSLRYPGATPGDQATIDAAGGIYNVVPFNVQVAGSLRLDGAEQKRFAAIIPGSAQTLELDFTAPNEAPVSLQHQVSAGSTYAIGLTAGTLDTGWAAGLKSALAGKTGDDFVEAEALAQVALYAQEQEAAAEEVGQLTHHVVLEDFMESLAGRGMLVQTSIAGVPTALSPANYFLDVKRDSTTEVTLDRDPSQEANLLRFLSVEGSLLESRTGEQLFANAGESTVTLFHAAAAQGVLLMTLSNPSGVALLTGYGADALADISNSLSAGWQVIAPQHPVGFLQYPPVEAYALLNPVTGTGAHLIFGLDGQQNTGQAQATPDSNCQCPASPPSPSVPSAVDLFDGTLRESSSDLTLPGVGIPLVFSRQYSSRSSNSADIGFGWEHSYGIHLRLEPNGDVTYFPERLQMVRFAKTGSTFTPPPGFFLTLTTQVGGYHLRDKHGVSWDFDSTGKLLAINDTSGNSVQLVYSSGQLTQVKDATGAVGFTLGYTNGLITSVTDRSGRSVHFVYTNGDLTSATDALGVPETYIYDSNHNLISRTDRRGKTFQEFYDLQDRWVGFLDAEGNSGAAVYDPVNLRTTYFDATGAPWQYVFGSSGEVLSKVDPLGQHVDTVRDANFNPLSEVDGRGLPTVMTYDAQGNQLTLTAPDGRLNSTTYDPTFNNPLVQTSTGLPQVTNTYDTAGRLKTRQDGLGTTTYGYDTQGQLHTVLAPGALNPSTFVHNTDGTVASVTDATGRPTALGYDSAGHLNAVTDGNLHTRTMVPDALGRVQSMTDAIGNPPSSFTYDGSGNRLTTTDANNKTTTFAYDGNGRLTSTTDALNNVTRTEYDAEGRVAAVVDAKNNRSTRKYDLSGRLVETTDALGNTTTQSYCADVPTSPCAEVDALGHLTTRTFDSVGRLLMTTDALNRPTIQTYDAAGRPSTVTGPRQPLTTSFYDNSTGLLSQRVTTGGATVLYQYDSRGNRTLVQTGSATVPNGEFSRYTYDDANRLLTEKDPLNHVTTYTYDAAGSRQTKLDGNNHLTTYGYDFNRRLNLVTFDDGTYNQYDYDSRGNRILEKGPSHERHLVFDELNRLQTTTDTTLGKAVTYGYDERGNRTSLSEGSLQQHFSYDARNMLQAAWEGSGTKVVFSYDALGRRFQVVRPNGVTSSYAYDDVGELLSLQHVTAGQTLLGFGYSYDDRGRRTSKSRIDTGTTEVYGYDAIDHLTRVDYPSYSATYNVDGLGNRSQETGNFVGGTGASFNAFNQVTQRRNDGSNYVTNYTYDNNGNLALEATSLGGATAINTTYAWDRDNRLRQVVQGTVPLLGQPGGTTSYNYDANGLRINRTDSTGVVNYLLTGPSVLEELDSLNNPTTQLLNHPQAIDDVVSFDKGGATYYPLTDALGSVYAIADSAGAIARRYDYDVWGVRTDLGGAGPTVDFGYTGRWHDGNGIIDHRQRQRNPRTSGWLNKDLVGGTAGPNAYGYVDHRPTAETDSAGLIRDSVSTSFAAALILALEAEGPEVAEAINEAAGLFEDLTGSENAGRMLQTMLEGFHLQEGSGDFFGKCEYVANTFGDIYQSIGEHIQYMKIETIPPNVNLGFDTVEGVSTSSQPLTYAGYHWATVVDGNVYDFLTAPEGGLPVQDYLDRLYPPVEQLIVTFQDTKPPVP